MKPTKMYLVQIPTGDIQLFICTILPPSWAEYEQMWWWGRGGQGHWFDWWMICADMNIRTWHLETITFLTGVIGFQNQWWSHLSGSQLNTGRPVLLQVAEGYRHTCPPFLTSIMGLKIYWIPSNKQSNVETHHLVETQCKRDRCSWQVFE